MQKIELTAQESATRQQGKPGGGRGGGAAAAASLPSFVSERKDAFAAAGAATAAEAFFLAHRRSADVRFLLLLRHVSPHPAHLGDRDDRPHSLTSACFLFSFLNLSNSGGGGGADAPPAPAPSTECLSAPRISLWLAELINDAE